MVLTRALCRKGSAVSFQPPLRASQICQEKGKSTWCGNPAEKKGFFPFKSLQQNLMMHQRAECAQARCCSADTEAPHFLPRLPRLVGDVISAFPWISELVGIRGNICRCVSSSERGWEKKPAPRREGRVRDNGIVADKTSVRHKRVGIMLKMRVTKKKREKSFLF